MDTTLVYTLTVTNHGPDAATAVVSDIIIGPATIVSINPSQGSCQGTNTITCNLGNLNNQTSATVEIIVAPSEAGTLNNIATVTSGTSDPNAQNNSATLGTVINPPPPDDQGGGGPIDPGPGNPSSTDASNTQETPLPNSGGCAMNPKGEPDWTWAVLLGWVVLSAGWRRLTRQISVAQEGAEA